MNGFMSKLFVKIFNGFIVLSSISGKDVLLATYETYSADKQLPLELF